MRVAVLALLAVVAAARGAAAQSEEQLRAFFEGKSVIVQIEMPGTQEGVDVHPGTPQPVAFPDVARRLKRYGTAIRRGDQVMITKVKVKDDLIEFQLGGGGYGTFGDDASPDVHVPLVPKSAREKDLERQLDQTADPAQKQRIRSQIDDLRRQRQREDARNQARAAEARQLKEANIRQRRAEGGSRFNLRYKTAVPAEAVTPDGVMQALAEYVDFSPISGRRRAVPDVGNAPDRRDDLHKGLSVDEVDAMLGRPESITQRREGTLSVSACSYRTPDGTITAEFVEGVLVRFTVARPPR